jgi:hypothetical protein
MKRWGVGLKNSLPYAWIQSQGLKNNLGVCQAKINSLTKTNEELQKLVDQFRRYERNSKDKH